MVNLAVVGGLQEELVFAFALRFVEVDERFQESVARLRERVRNARAERLRWRGEGEKRTKSTAERAEMS